MLKSNGRLTQKGVDEVHRLRAAGRTYQQIAVELNVCVSTIYNIIKGRTRGRR